MNSQLPSRPIAVVTLLLALLATSAAHGAGRLEVRIEGLAGALLDNARGFLAIAQVADDDDLTAERVALLHARAPAQLVEALEPFGHYRPKVDASVTRDDNGWVAVYRVDPGPRIPLARVDVVLEGDAADDPGFAELLAAFPVREGQPLAHADYDRARDALLRRAAARGYFDAILSRHELHIDLDAYRAEVRLTLAAGRRYRFGAVDFGDPPLDLALLARYVPFRDGEPYLAGRLLELQAALIDSGYFAEVQVVPRPADAVEGRVPVDVVLEPRAGQRYSAGLGYGTDTGGRGRLGWESRRLNRAGHRANVRVELAERRRALLAQYTVPVRDPRNEQFVFSANVLDETTESAQTRSDRLGVALQLGRSGWRMTYGLDLKHERSRIGGERQDALLVIPGVTWSRVYTADDRHVESGWRVGIDLHGGAEALGSDVSFLQLAVDGKHVVAAPWPGGRLIGRWALGTTWTDDFSALPASERFFAGGDQSIRGYGWNALGPVNSAGEVIGGRSLAVGSIEVEHYFAPTWGVALFQDVGYAFDGASDPVFRGRGVGLRWRSPIGTVRVDIAQAQDGAREPWRLHLVVGPDL